MKKNLVVSIVLLLGGMFLFSSCSKLPQAEIDAAQVAIDEAKTAGAELYAFNEYTSLVDSMSAVMEGIEAQKSKLFKSYKTSKEGLAGVTTLAVDVKVAAETKIAELKAEIEKTIAEANAVTEENKVLVESAPKGKGGATVLLAIKEDIATIEAGVAALAVENAGENLNDKLTSVQALKGKALEINGELKSVIEKYQAKGKK